MREGARRKKSKCKDPPISRLLISLRPCAPFASFASTKQAWHASPNVRSANKSTAMGDRDSANTTNTNTGSLRATPPSLSS